MKMTDKYKVLDKQIEAVQISIYCDIIKNLLIKYRSMSIVKITAFSFVIKKNSNLQLNCFSAKNTTDLVLKFLSQAAGRNKEFYSQLIYIFEALDLLIKNKACDIHDSEILCNLPADWDVKTYDNFTCAAIEESKTYTDRQFLKEVISVV